MWLLLLKIQMYCMRLLGKEIEKLGIFKEMGKTQQSLKVQMEEILGLTSKKKMGLEMAME